MEEDIKILESFIRSIRSDLLDKENSDNFELAQALENLLTRYKQLEEENKQLKLRIKDIYVSRGEYEKAKTIMTKELREFIPKSKIKEKIEELKDNGCCRGNEFYKGQCVTICQNYSGCMALQELLEEE